MNMVTADFLRFTAKVAKQSVREYFQPLTALVRWVNGPLYIRLYRIYHPETTEKAPFSEPLTMSAAVNAVVRSYETTFWVRQGVNAKALEHIIERYINKLKKYDVIIVSSNRESVVQERRPLGINDAEKITFQFKAINLSLLILDKIHVEDTNLLSFETQQLTP